MFLIEVSPDELSYLKRTLDKSSVIGTDAVLHAEIRKRCDQPIIGEKLVADIQHRARQNAPGGAPPQEAPAMPVMPAMPSPEPIPGYPMSPNQPH